MPALHDLAATHIYDLVAMALGATHNSAAIANRRGTRAARLRAIKADILENLGDELTLTAVAFRQGVTPRYIHMLFETEGLTFCEFVLGQRLMRAHGMLVDPHFAELSITTIAFAAGFGDLSYFNRTFRRRFGTTPSELRTTIHQDERSSRPKERRLPTCRGEGRFGSVAGVPAFRRFGPIKAQKQTGAKSRPKERIINNSLGKSLSVLISVYWAVKGAAFGKEISLRRFHERERKVRRDFWAKLERFAGRTPCVEDFVAAYYCAMDSAPPTRVRGTLLAALAYFIVPFDLVPDVIPGCGFTDDAALLGAIIGRVSPYITPIHRRAARALAKGVS